MPRVLIHEGSSGILDLSGAETGRFVPDCDLDKALKLLFTLYELKAANGKTFKENYHFEDFNWLSGQLGFIYWRCLYRFVQYKDFLARCLSGELTPIFRQGVNFMRLFRLFEPREKRVPIKNAIYYQGLIPRHNARLSRKKQSGMLFYRYGPGDFRTRDILAHFLGKGIDFTFVYSPSTKLYRHRNTQERPVYFLYRPMKGENPFRHDYDLSGLDPLTARLFGRIIATVESRMASNLRHYRLHLENLSRMRPSLFFGLDDHNEVYPILYALKTLGIPSLGYQLGMYSRLQAAYALERWQRGEYDWYDQVIVWGEYWEEVARRYTDAYPPGFFLLGANKNTYDYSRPASPKFDVKNVLIPYEFFANTYKIGLYIQKLIDLGYRVYFKFKPDERPERQLESYCLPEEYAARLVPVTDITPQLMAEVNIVAGAMTTLLYDLLPYGKHTWVLETEFGLLDDMVADGYAERVRLEELDAMPLPGKAERNMDWTRIFNNRPLTQVLDDQVLSRL